MLAPEISAIVQRRPDAPGLEPRHAALLRAVDELDTEFFVGDHTWEQLIASYDIPQLLEMCLLVGHYRAFAMLMA